MRQSSSGFTLVELLVALFVFALLSAFAYSAINQLLSAESYIQAENEELQDIQKTLLLWEKDFRQSINYKPNNVNQNNEKVERLFIPGDQSFTNEPEQSGRLLVELFIPQPFNNQLLKRSYWLKEAILYQKSEVIGSSISRFANIGNQSTHIPLLRKLNNVSISILNAGNGLNQDVHSFSVELLLDHQDFGQVKRVVFLGLPKSTMPTFTLARLSGILDGASGSAETQVGGPGGGSSNGSNNNSESEDDTPPPPTRPVCLDPFAGNEEC